MTDRAQAALPGVTAAGVLALILLHLQLVLPTNFGGFDEWMVLELGARNVVSVPYCHRPFNWVWSWPAARLVSTSFAPFSWVFAAYTVLSSWLAFRLVRRLAPERPQLALLTAVFIVVWAPGDMARLSSVDRVLYSGETLAVLAAMAALVEAWLLGSRLLLALALGVAALAALSYEGTLALLAAAPLLLWLRERPAPRLIRWTALWEALVALACCYFVLAAWAWGTPYQLEVLAPTRDPVTWLSRLLLQYAYHLFPLALAPFHELLVPAVGAAVLVVLAMLAAAARGASLQDVGAPRALVGIAALGLALAGLGYSLIVLGVALPTAYRLEILSGPGMALALAAGVLLLASLARGHGRQLLVASLTAWIVAVGTGRTAAMQTRWNNEGWAPRQGRMLASLTAALPNVRPHTLIVLLDDGRAWQASFGFHHAVQYLYERRASGLVWRAWNALYPVSFGQAGVRMEPWAICQGPWQAWPEDFRYEDLVVVRHDPAGGVEVLSRWPEVLPPLPAGAAYAPEARLAPGPLRRRLLLDSL